ncbi:MAG: hydrolase [Fibrobacterales bacterium]
MNSPFMKQGALQHSDALLNLDKSVLLIIDIQERLVPSVFNAEEVLANTALLLESARVLGVPVLATEQYSKGLGHTHPELALEETIPVYEKTVFSALGTEDAETQGLFSKLKELGRDQIVVCGIETHVCVLQTVLDLMVHTNGWVYPVVDACGSRSELNWNAGIERMSKNGAQLVTAEMVVFEWLEKAGTPEFKEIQKMIL